MNIDDLKKEIDLAKKTRDNAYAPYSNYRVGAVLKTKDGKIYSGCNIENYGIQSICAERVAFSTAISLGEKDFKYIIIVGGIDNNLEECVPCGYCRQFMSEFVEDDFLVYTISDNKLREYTIKELLPKSFKF